jgi:hypothetical protein
MEERRGSGWFGLPAMIGLLVVVAVAKLGYGLGGIFLAVFIVLLVFLIIGALMTLANKE